MSAPTTMSGLRTMIATEWLAWRRGARLVVIVVLIAIFAFLSPIAAYYLPAILSSLGDSALRELIPEPTAADAATQWTKNLTQIVLIALIVIAGGAIAGNVARGTAQFLLTRGVSRAAYVTATMVVGLVITLATSLLGSLVAAGMTALLFADGVPVRLVAATAAWCVAAALLLAVTWLASAALASQIGAAGIGIGAFFVLQLLAIWPPAARYSPAGILALPGRIATESVSGAELWLPIATSLLSAAVIAYAAIEVFRRRELP